MNTWTACDHCKHLGAFDGLAFKYQHVSVKAFGSARHRRARHSIVASEASNEVSYTLKFSARPLFFQSFTANKPVFITF